MSQESPVAFVTCDLCDEHSDNLQVVEPVFKDFGARRVFSGEVVTVKCFEDNSVVKQQLKEVDGTDKVLVVDGGGSVRHALMGDQIAAGAVANGWEGVIIHGAIRDVDEIAPMDLGVKALAAIPIKSIRKDRGDLNLPIRFAGVHFEPGDYVYADNNGIIVSPTKLL